jgi:hypothetical protein
LRELFLIGLLLLLGAAPGHAEEWRVCRDSALAAPGSWSCHCFYSLAKKTGDWQRARQELARLGASDDPYWLFTRGRVEDAAAGCAASEPLFRRAAELFAAAGEGQGETWSRGNLLRCLERSDLGAAKTEGEKLFALAQRTGDPKLVATAALRRIQVAISALDFAAAEALLAEYPFDKLDALDPSSELGLEWLGQHLRLSHGLGRIEAARRDAAERIARAEKRQDPQLLARVHLDAASFATQLPPTADNREALRKAAREALAAAEKGGDLGVLVPALLLHGRLENDAALLARCGRLAKETGDAHHFTSCRFAEAATVAATDPARAERLLAEGDAFGHASGDPLTWLQPWSDHLRAIFVLRPRAEALAVSRRLLGEVEKVRSAESSGARSAELFGVWREIHDWLAGRLLESGDPAEAELAFGLLENARARVLREILGDSPSAGLGSAPARPLAEIAAGLDENEALLSFQLDHERNNYGHPDGGGAVFVTTRGGTRVVRLPDRGRVEPAIAIWLGDIGSRRESPELARRLGALIFDKVAAVLPAGTRRLIVVPDGPLFQLPWALLRDDAGRPLAERYEIVLAPAASLPHRPGDGGAGGAGGRALILADPAFPASAGLPRLPHAESEGREVRRLLGGRLWAGAEASEPRFRGEDLAPYALVHFAAHALLDDEQPERSALLLAPGGEGGDGRLEPREIAGLRLAGKMVTLASCRSASGRVLPGEGPMSLGRAFLAAGAPVVLGSLWMLRDDEAEAFFGKFYSRLAAGETAAAALAATQRELAAGGAPAAAWAGVVLLGDGDFRLAPRSRLGQLARSPGRLALFGLAAAATLAACRFLRRRRGPKAS